MRSVADDFRRAGRERVLLLSPGERILLTSRLAAWDLELFCRARHLPHEAARRMLASRRHAGRRPSRVMERP